MVTPDRRCTDVGPRPLSPVSGARSSQLIDGGVDGREPAGPPRQRLLAALSGDERLILIHGPRLSGKTNLVRTWLEDSSHTGTSVGIVSPKPDISEHDYWAEVLQSLSSGVQHLGAHHISPTTVPALTVGASGHPFAALCAAIESHSQPLSLVLDDLHLVEKPEARVRELLQHAPPRGLRIIVTTRTVASWYRPAGLPRDRVLLTPHDLLLTDTEISALLDSAGVALDRRSRSALNTKVDGMAGLLATAVDVLRTPASGGEQVDHALAAVDRLVDHTLRMDPWLERQRWFVFGSAAAVPLTEAAATALTDAASAHAQLDMLERLGMVLPNAEATEPTWIIPAPVRASLLRLAEAEDPQQLREVRIALARHWLDRGRPHTAFVHAIDAQEWDFVVNVLREHWRTLYTTDFLHMDRDLAQIPPAVLESEPLFDTLRRMHRQFSAPKDTPAPRPQIDTRPDTQDNAEQLMHAFALRLGGEFEAAATECEPLSRLPAPDPDTSTSTERDGFAFVCLHVGICFLLAGRFEDAIQVLRRGHRAGRGTYIERDAAGKLALAHAVLGHVQDAEFWVEEENRHPPLPAASESVVRPAGMVAAALASLDRLDTGTALDLITELGAPDDSEEFWGFMLYAYGQLALTTGTPTDGLRYIDLQLRRFPTMHDHGAVVGHLLTSVRADLLLALGRPEGASELVSESAHPFTAATRARIRLLTGDLPGAMSIVDDYDTDLRCTVRDSIELSLVGAAGSITAAAPATAQQYLHRAITQSRLTGLRRPFTTLPPNTVRELLALGLDFPIDPDQYPSIFPISQASVPPISLTDRELVILRSLASGATISAIAKQHVVSVNTVKSQLRSVYRKLSTRSRTDTVEVARCLGLV